MATGSCVCGAVAFEITGEGSAFQYCHCSRCRKASGTAHAANLFVGPDQLTFTRGLDQVARFELPDADFWCNAFCIRCGAKAPWLSKTGRAWIVPAGALDDDPGLRPTRNIFFASRGSWFVCPHELDTFDTFPARPGS